MRPPLEPSWEWIGFRLRLPNLGSWKWWLVSIWSRTSWRNFRKSLLEFIAIQSIGILNWEILYKICDFMHFYYLIWFKLYRGLSCDQRRFFFHTILAAVHGRKYLKIRIFWRNCLIDLVFSAKLMVLMRTNVPILDLVPILDKRQNDGDFLNFWTISCDRLL